VDTREVQPHDTGEKEQLGLASVKVEPGSTSATTTSSTGTRLLHGILSQHPQQHGLGLQNGYGRHLAGHAQMGQPPYTTAAIATTSTPGKGSQALTGMRSDEILTWIGLVAVSDNGNGWSAEQDADVPVFR